MGFLLIVALAQAPSPPLTIAAAVQLAKQHNPDIEEARAAVEAAREVRKAARSVFRPSFEPRLFGALGSDSVANQQFGAELSQRFLTGTRFSASFNTASARNQLGTYYYGETSFALTQSLFGGRDPGRRDLESATQAIDAALAREKATQERVAIDVAAACYAIVTEELVAAAAEKAIERYRQLLAVAEAKLEIGQVSQLDVLRAQRLVRQAAARVDAARAGADNARDTLRELVGGGVPDVFTVSIDQSPAGDDIGIEAAVSAALSNSAEIHIARARVADAERQTAGKSRGGVPRLDFTLALTRRETASTLQSSFGADRFRLVPFIQLTMPDRGVKAADLAAASELARLRREMRSAELKLEMSVRRAVRDIARLAADLADAGEEVSFSERQADVARERFTHGLSNNLDVITAETELIDAQARRFSAASTLALARLRLKAIIE